MRHLINMVKTYQSMQILLQIICCGIVFSIVYTIIGFWGYHISKAGAILGWVMGGALVIFGIWALQQFIRDYFYWNKK